MSTITILVGNIGTVLETSDSKEASDVYRHYCDQSDRGNGRMARENVTMTVIHRVWHEVDCRWTEEEDITAEHVGYDARLEAMDDDAFMKSDVTSKQTWYEVDTSDGIDYISIDLVGDLPGLSNAGDIVSLHGCRIDTITSDDQTTIKTALADYVSVCDVEDINTIERIEGYGARLSASGYMDCTEFVVFKTEHDAIVYLVETYENQG